MRCLSAGGVWAASCSASSGISTSTIAVPAAAAAAAQPATRNTALRLVRMLRAARGATPSRASTISPSPPGFSTIRRAVVPSSPILTGSPGRGFSASTRRAALQDAMNTLPAR